ncbi:hypothetical protein B0H11DRAFT_209674 [Mycena galericulata]|nr:hypothetical protein B0H11DRAFT_209674 [Mycena galericulata]
MRFGTAGAQNRTRYPCLKLGVFSLGLAMRMRTRFNSGFNMQVQLHIYTGSMTYVSQRPADSSSRERGHFAPSFRTPDYPAKCLIPIPTNLEKFSRYPCIKSRQIGPKSGAGLCQIPTKTRRAGKKIRKLTMWGRSGAKIWEFRQFGPIWGSRPVPIPTNLAQNSQLPSRQMGLRGNRNLLGLSGVLFVPSNRTGRTMQTTPLSFSNSFRQPISFPRPLSERSVRFFLAWMI